MWSGNRGGVGARLRPANTAEAIRWAPSTMREYLGSKWRAPTHGSQNYPSVTLKCPNNSRQTTENLMEMFKLIIYRFIMVFTWFEEYQIPPKCMIQPYILLHSDLPNIEMACFVMQRETWDHSDRRWPSRTQFTVVGSGGENCFGVSWVLSGREGAWSGSLAELAASNLGN